MILHPFTHRIIIAFSALALLAGAPPAHAAPPSGSGWNLVWGDEFEGDSLDLSKWQHRATGTRRQAINTPGAVKLAAGNLTISTFTIGSTHYTGMVSSDQTFLYTYGYVEARINYDTSPGMWSAFWMQSPTMTDKAIYDLDPNLAGTEIDICEHRAVDAGGGNISSKIVGNIHWKGYGADHDSTGYTSPNLDLGGGYHIYGMEWTPTQQKFYIDGILRWTVDNGSNSPVSNRSEYIWLSSEVENSATVDWAGPVPAGGYGSLDTTTTKMVVDYVRVYQAAEAIANDDFSGRLAPFEAANEATWSSTGGGTQAKAGKLAPATAAGASLRQTLNGLMPDTGYTLTAWGNAGSTSPSLFMGVEDHGFPSTGQTLTSNAYAQATVPFITGSSNRSATVVARSNNAGSLAYVDDFLLRRHASVTNGQFETGDSHAWSNPYGGAVVASNSSYGGDYALRFPVSTEGAGAEQAITGLSPGTTYRLTGWTTNSDSGLSFGVKNHGSAQVMGNVAASTWTQAIVNFTTGAASTGATIFAYRGSGTQIAYADAFFLSQPFTAPWTGDDVGAVGLTGTSGRLGEKFVVQATGTGMSGGVDRCHFIQQPHNGDGTLTARILGADIVSNNTEAGLMLRDTTNTGSRAIALTWNPVTGQIDFFRRTGTGGTTPVTISTLPGSVPSPPWLRLTRRVNDFTPYWSADGEKWTRVDQPRAVSMVTPMLAGLVLASGDEARLSEATFDKVTLTAAVPDVQITQPSDGTAHAANGASLRMIATLTGGSGATIQWSKVSGPGAVTFTNSTANATTATTYAAFSAPGVYQLRCSATTAAGNSTDDHTVHVTQLFAADPALVLNLKLDESTGTVATDSSGSANHGSTNGGVTWLPAGGKFSGAAGLNGTDAYLSVPDDPSLDNTPAFTLSCWFKADNFNGGSGLLGKRLTDTSQNAYSIACATSMNFGRLRFDINSNTDRFLSNTVFSTGAWYHLALVFDGTQPSAQRAKLYVNGVLDITATETSTSVMNSSAPLLIGRLSETDTNFFDGMVDAVRFHRRALSAVEIAGLANESAVAAPVVSAGPAPAAMINNAASLAGSVDVGTGPAATALWTKTSGPGTTVFGNAASPATSVTFNQTGLYQLRLTATSTSGQVYQNLEVQVAAPSNDPGTYAGWKELSWPGLNDDSTTGPNADPDKDGIVNQLEFAFLTDPTRPGGNPFRVSSAPPDTLTFEFPWNWRATGLTWQIRHGNDLSNIAAWPVVPPGATTITREGDIDRITVTPAMAYPDRGFYVLQVSGN